MSMAAQHHSGSGKHSLRSAWTWVASLPVAFAVAMVTGEGLISAMGYESGGEPPVPLVPALLAGTTAMLIVLVPSYFAFRAGMKARREGDERGTLPAVAGATIGILFLLTNLLSVFVR